MSTLPKPRPRAFSVLLTLAASVVACSPEFNWRDTRFPEADNVFASFPCKPDRMVRRLPLAGEQVGFALASCAVGGVTFAIGHAEMSDGSRVASASNALESLASTRFGVTAAAVPARVVGAGLDPAPRRIDLRAKRPDGKEFCEQALFFVRGKHVFQASVVGVHIPSEVGETFFAGIGFPP